MGINCCCSRPGKDDHTFDYYHTNIIENAKAVIKFESNEKIRNIDYSESFRVKRYKLKHKKRLILVDEDNTIWLFSFYLGNLTFLLSAFKVNDAYKILKCCFLSKSNSTRFCIILEDQEKKALIFIMKINKDMTIPNIELNIQSNTEKEDIIKQKHNSYPNKAMSNSELYTEETGEQIKYKNNKNHQDKSIPDLSLFQKRSNSVKRKPLITPRNKKAVESIINSSSSSNDSDSDEVNHSNLVNEDLILSEDYDDSFASKYFTHLNKIQARKIYEDMIMVKFNNYFNSIKLLIDDNNKKISSINIENDYIYSFSNKTKELKCYKIHQNLKKFTLIFNFRLNNPDPLALNLIFPLFEDKFFVVERLNINFYSKGYMEFSKEFKEFYPEYIAKNLEVIKFTKVICNTTESKLKKSKKNYSPIINFYITGLCIFNKNTSYEPDQFISKILIDFNSTNFNQLKEQFNISDATTPFLVAKIKILKNTPTITEMSYGPFNNGPIITGHIDGTITLWNIYNLTSTKIIRAFEQEIPIKIVISEPFGVTLCCNDKKLTGVHLIEKKYEYFYNENENYVLQRVIRLNNPLEEKI